MTGADPLGQPPVAVDQLLEALRAVLREGGITDVELAAAEEQGLLLLLGIEHLVLSSPPRYRFDEVVSEVGMDPAIVRRFWRSLGLPDAAPDDVAFGDADRDALVALKGLLDAGVADPTLSLQMTRVVGSATSRIADAQIAALKLLRDQRERREHAAEGGPHSSLPVGAAAFIPTLENLLVYAWRRHLQAAARRELLAERSAAGGEVERAVGFADVVGFTTLAGQVSDQELVAVIERFSELAYDTIAAQGGRVVKMIGDEVMFVADSAVAAIHVALALAETYADDEIVSDVRVGLSFGPVITIEGDFFGPTVNLASRAVTAAPPGGVLAGPRIHEQLSGVDGLEWRERPRTTLKGFGDVRLWQVWRAGDQPPPRYEGFTALVARLPKGPIGRALWERFERRS